MGKIIWVVISGLFTAVLIPFFKRLLTRLADNAVTVGLFAAFVVAAFALFSTITSSFSSIVDSFYGVVSSLSTSIHVFLQQFSDNFIFNLLWQAFAMEDFLYYFFIAFGLVLAILSFALVTIVSLVIGAVNLWVANKVKVILSRRGAD